MTIQKVVDGLVAENGIKEQSLLCLISNDEHGKTLSITNGQIQFTIPFEPIEEYLR